ncbi:hypothetical protein L484_005281 [Morus notabilis]|uniref:Uncharacterized protein n=1 Tax=Morus notabilis TaxID=981085 RepID=W9QBX5_9ROSA|nr:hypothetical protein L484_005281 [Morus notabilis]
MEHREPSYDYPCPFFKMQDPCFFLAEKGTPTTRVKLKSEFKENEMKCKRLNSKVEEEKDHKKHKQQQKDKSCNKNKHRDFSSDSTLEQLKKEWDNVCTLIGLVNDGLG